MEQRMEMGSDGYVQVAYIVADIEQAAMEWVEKRGAGPFFLKQYKTSIEVEYRGQRANLDHISAYGQYGTLMVELIQPQGDGPSVYLGDDNRIQEGLHHFAQICPDLDTALAAAERLGYPLACRSGTAQTPVAFVDARRQLGHFIELCQDTPSLRYLYRFVADAAREWDGNDPLRTLGGPGGK